MKKYISILIILILIVTACSNNSKNYKTMNARLYNYSIYDYQNNPDDHDYIVGEIIKIWEKNDEAYLVNFGVNVSSVRTRLNEYIKDTSDYSQSIFKICCEIVKIDFNSYKVK